MNAYYCYRCKEIMDEPFRRHDTDLERRPVIHLECVKCGSDELEEIQLCDACKLEPAAVGIDYCKSCWNTRNPEDPL